VRNRNTRGVHLYLTNIYIDDTSFLKLNLCLLVLLAAQSVYSAVGDTTACKWKDNKRGAFNFSWDGDYDSARKVAMPKIIARNLTTSLYYNPGLPRYANGIDFWETAPNRYGWFLGHHQMECKNGLWDSGSMTDAYYQVGEAARIIWGINPPGKTRLHIMTEWPEGSSGGLNSTQWNELQTVFSFIRCTVIGTAGGYTMPDDTWTYAQLIARPQAAITNGSFTGLLFHQIGQYGEYGYVVNETYFEQYLDWLVANSGSLWVGNNIDIYAYMQEYNNRTISVASTTPNIIVNLTSTQDPALYTFPLTLITQVPSGWTYCKVTQGPGQTGIDAKKIYPVDVWASSRTVMYEAIPGWGQITLESSSPDSTPPNAPAVRDGYTSGFDIDTTTATDYLAANWDACTDAETGMKRYWYKIGTTAGGAEVFDWIDNGLQSSATVRRTNLSLIRGVTYYFTVKAENGQGAQSSESISDGQCVDTMPGYIKFTDDFESGGTSNWTSASGATVSAAAAHLGNYGLLLSQSNTLTKNSVNSDNDLYVGLSFKLAPNFSLGSGSLNLVAINPASGNYTAQLRISYNSAGYLLSGHYITDITTTHPSGVWASVPESPSTSFAAGVCPIITPNTWYRLDIHTKSAGDKKGGVEIWLNGSKVTSRLFTYNTLTKAARNVIISMSTGTGNIYVDNITMSDSLMPMPTAYSAASVDTSSPTAPGAVYDGTGADASFTYSTTSLSANWTSSADADSGISGYRYAIGTTAGGINTAGWTSLGNVLTITRMGLPLSVGTTYYFSVKAVNGIGLVGLAVNSNGQFVKLIDTSDTTPPPDISAVRDGTGTDIAYSTATTTLCANWDSVTDPESGTARYWYAIGTQTSGSGVSDTKAWTDNGVLTSINAQALALTVGVTYYVSVKAENGVGLQSSTTTSNGQYIAEVTTGTVITPPVIPPSTAPVISPGIRFYPNPCKPTAASPARFIMKDNTGGEVNIYTLSGRLVKKLSVPAGSGSAAWDGKNSDGEKARQGIYVYKITGNSGETLSGKLALTK